MRKLQWRALDGIKIQETFRCARTDHHNIKPMSPRKKKYCYLLLIVTTTYIALRNFRTFEEPWKPNQEWRRFEDFKKDWCRIRNLRVNWEQMLAPCNGQTLWNTKDSGWEKENETDPDMSFISIWDIRPAGEFSKFSIVTQTKSGWLKTIGGDSWRVHVNGPTSVEGTIFDHMNGTYEVVFLLTIPGAYNIEIVLDHSLCNGLTDPPPNWFILGSAQGKNQKEGVLGSERPYLLKQLWGGTPVTITVAPSPPQGPLYKVIQRHAQTFDLKCGVQCNIVWDGYGNWIRGEKTHKWQPFVTSDDKKRKSVFRPGPSRPNSVLWIYGDSVSEQFFHGIHKHPMCEKVFRWCGHTYNWVYQLTGNQSTAKTRDDDLDYDYFRVVEEVRDVIRLPIFDSDSVILLNAGLHYLESTNFTNYQKTIDGIVNLFKEIQMDAKEIKRAFPGKMIWKSSTSLNKQKLDGKHLQSRRFLTAHRLLLYNAYATNAMCSAGFDVLDVYPLTASYPYGTGTPSRPNDAVHYEHFVFESVERLLEDYFERNPTS